MAIPPPIDRTVIHHLTIKVNTTSLILIITKTSMEPRHQTICNKGSQISPIVVAINPFVAIISLLIKIADSLDLPHNRATLHLNEVEEGISATSNGPHLVLGVADIIRA
jgi:hypothetical protein